MIPLISNCFCSKYRQNFQTATRHNNILLNELLLNLTNALTAKTCNDVEGLGDILQHILKALCGST